MTYEKAKSIQEDLYIAMQIAGKELQSYPRNEIGLTPDHIKFSPEYRAKKLAYDTAHKSLRDFNAKFNRLYKTQIKNERLERRGNNEPR